MARDPAAIVRPQSPAMSGSNPYNKDELAFIGKVQCYGCQHEVNRDHHGITCLQSHHLCPDCTPNFINQIFDDPGKNIPVKCMICCTEVPTTHIERNMGVKQMQTYLRYFLVNSKTAMLAKDEIVMNCPFCDYWEIQTKAAGMNFFYCKAAGSCAKMSCTYCSKNVPIPVSDEKTQEAEKHFECAELHPYKKIWETALEDGEKMFCPECKIGGRKNNACTHMTCPNCDCQWCYLCGLSFDDQDKKGGMGVSLFAHNQEWETNGKRCPAWLNEICKVDKRWPQDQVYEKYGALALDKHANACSEFFHQHRTMQLLREAYEKIGKDTFKRLCKKYGLDANCGYDMKEILTGDHTIIIRQ